MNNIIIAYLYRYLELLTKAYFDGDPLNVKPSIEKTLLLIEMEINKGIEMEEVK
ncbi:hypothetical protein AB1L05_21765 [Cytobacillus horneckiae]|uniref:hypothetical protein n=1 Tax=Cytobacillus horneckiae TaxID=549687 RepID=UPI0039A33C71